MWEGNQGICRKQQIKTLRKVAEGDIRKEYIRTWRHHEGGKFRQQPISTTRSRQKYKNMKVKKRKIMQRNI